MVKPLGVLCVAASLPAALLADFSYDQTTKMTGGAMMGMMRLAGAFSKQVREPIQGSVSVKGNKMVHTTRDHAELIDLDSETITSIDYSKKTYSVMTFAEMAQMMEQATQKMKEKKADADFKVSLKSTGNSKQISGYDAKEMLMTFTMEATDQKTGQKGGMLVTSDMWIASQVAGYDEIRAFHKKMAAKLAWTPGGGAMMAGNPEIGRGMSEIYKEAAKLDGMPVLQVVKMAPTDAEGKPLQAPAGSDSSSQQSKPKADAPSIGSVLGGRLGGFGGLGRKKKQAEETKKEEPAPEASSQPSGSTDASLIEMTTEMSGFSSASVDGSKFAVPSGFKKVDSPAARQSR